jgi:hypothetical protein
VCLSGNEGEHARPTRDHEYLEHGHSVITIRHGIPRRVHFAANTASTIMKRAHEGEDDEHTAKVRRLLKPDRLSRLSEELLVRILSFVPVPSLLVCQR